MMLLASLRMTVITMTFCVAIYTAAVLGFAKLAAPAAAEGSLIRLSNGTVIGSHLLAQPFSEARYFWPRPSATHYNAAGSGGSNLAATSPALRKRAEQIVDRYGATRTHALPADLATASGSGLDPDISAAAALYQAPRIAQARRRDARQIRALVRRLAFAPGGFLTPEKIVNVLELNLALDSLPNP